jgi:2-keto-4-pentenoate hydratase/2-oxohepta-3-ene-1,7-dioic acid hydratase in catechol pathway
MKRVIIAIALTLACAPALFAQAQGQAQEPFKLGTFEENGRAYLGLVVRDALVANIAQASAALPGAKPTIPGNMTELIMQYETLRPRLYAIATAAAAAATSGTRPGYLKDVKSVKILPPIIPKSMLNAASNYEEHDTEMRQRGNPNAPPPQAAPVPAPIPGIWERTAGDQRQNPYVFPKLSSTIIADGEAIRMPVGRDRVDWECELSVVVSKTAARVPVNRAAEYIFGYTLQNDVSDRGGRADRRHGSDWFLQKNHDTFAPLGPFIVPKEFVPDPLNLGQKFTLSGNVMQDSNTSRMTHNMYDMLSYVSNIITLAPGDIIALGSPAGVGTARATPIYMKAGDVGVCTIEKIGTLTNPVVAASTTTSGR